MRIAIHSLGFLFLCFKGHCPNVVSIYYESLIVKTFKQSFYIFKGTMLTSRDNEIKLHFLGFFLNGTLLYPATLINF